MLRKAPPDVFPARRDKYDKDPDDAPLDYIMNSSRAHSEMAQLSCVGSDWEMIFWAAHATPGIKVQLALRVSAAAM